MAVVVAHLTDVGLLKAWSIWLSGKSTAELTLWGHPMFYWSRVGKGLQFLVALGVIVELVGPTRWAKFGQYCAGIDTAFKKTAADNNPFKNWYTRKPTRSERACVMLGFLFEACLAVWLLYNVYRVLQQRWDTITALSVLLLVGAVLAVCLRRIKVRSRKLSKLFYDFIGYFGTGVGLFIWMLLASFVYYVCVTPVVVFGGFLLRKLAALLNNESLNNLVKGVGLVVLAAGFHFDLLAS